MGSHADCIVNFHRPESLTLAEGSGSATGTCPTNDFLDFAILNSSVGFTTQICVDYDTDVGGEMTTLHMTIQPMCKVQDEDAQRWLICSWLRDASSPLCMARPDVECCSYVNNFISPPLESSAALSCQEYVEGDCNTFYGYNREEKGDATGIQQYALELVSCDGAVPPNPTCSRGLTGADSRKALETAAVGVGSGFVGIGMLILAAALYMRRRRLADQDQRAGLGGWGGGSYYDEAPITEQSPLVEEMYAQANASLGRLTPVTPRSKLAAQRSLLFGKSTSSIAAGGGYGSGADGDDDRRPLMASEVTSLLQ